MTDSAAAAPGQQVAKLLPAESAALEVVASEVGIGAGTLQRRREVPEMKRLLQEAQHGNLKVLLSWHGEPNASLSQQDSHAPIVPTK